MGFDPWWEERKELERPLRKMEQVHYREVAAGEKPDLGIYMPALEP